jgi:hypothetical protein
MMFVLRALLVLALIASSSAFFNMGSRASKVEKLGGYPIQCDEAVMAPKAHGTCEKPGEEEEMCLRESSCCPPLDTLILILLSSFTQKTKTSDEESQVEL